MGNALSGSPDPRLAGASRSFTKQELDELRSLFASLAGRSHIDAGFVAASAFQGHFGVRGPLGGRLFEMVTQKRNDGKLTFDDLVISKATLEKGSPDEIEEFIYQLCDITGDGMVTRSDLDAVLTSIHATLFTTKCVESGSKLNMDVLEVFLNAAAFTKEVGVAEEVMPFMDFKSWCALLPSIRKFMGSLLTAPTSGRPGFQIPRLHYPASLSPEALLLREEYAWHIGGAISHTGMEEWRLLYHSAINGLSFNTFIGNISSAEGPSLLIVKDADGYIFGGCASQPWERHGDFYGDMKSFLFQLFPKASIYRPTGANNNLQWCATNFSSESIPNGVGFGGRSNHFGLFVAASFDQGHSFASTTFSSPCLSRASRFRPEVIECWGLHAGGSQDRPPMEASKGTTVLERFKEDRNMLKMVGLANSSD